MLKERGLRIGKRVLRETEKPPYTQVYKLACHAGHVSVDAVLTASSHIRYHLYRYQADAHRLCRRRTDRKHTALQRVF